MPEGHKIGQPGPLIREIKPDEIATLKAKYAGNQESRLKSKSPPKSVVKAEIKGIWVEAKKIYCLIVHQS